MRCLTRWRSWMSHRVGCVGESGEEPFEVLGELDVGLGVVQLGVERVELGGDSGVARACAVAASPRSSSSAMSCSW